MILNALRAALAAVLLILPQIAAAQSPPAHPALWALKDDDTTIYLFGTIHALPEGYRWEDAAIERALAASDRLVVEAVIDRDPAVTAALMLKLGTAAPGTPPLAARVPAKDRAKFETMAAASRYPRVALDGLKTWAAALVLAGVTISTLGVTAGAGVEPRLEAEFRDAGKPIEGLETAEGQLGFFNALSEKDQRAFLAAVIEEPAGGNEDFAAMLTAWSRGDERAIARSFREDFNVSKALREALLVRRNAAWADTLAMRLATPGTSFVAVGAGHLAGKGSVIERLKARGLKVVRVD